MPPPNVGCTALMVGKSIQLVSPVMYAAPSASRAMSIPSSSTLPPRKVEYTRAVPSGVNFADKHVQGPDRRLQRINNSKVGRPGRARDVNSAGGIQGNPYSNIVKAAATPKMWSNSTPDR